MSDQPITFAVDPAHYRHWQLAVDPPVATLRLTVTPDAGLREDYELKLNSYDLSVDIELYDIVQRLRFEHPDVKMVVVTGGIDNVFCAGANIQMLAGSSHAHKVNFCKFTNETRNGIEDATANSGQTWIAAVNGTAAGGGYELALACDEILMIDDRATAVSLPEVPLLAVCRAPAVDPARRQASRRRDLADVFATRTEGLKAGAGTRVGPGRRRRPRSAFDDLVAERAAARAATSDRPDGAPGIELTPIERTAEGDSIEYADLRVDLDRELGAAVLTVTGPRGEQPATADELVAARRRARGCSLPSASSTTPSSTCDSTSPSSGTWVFKSGRRARRRRRRRGASSPAITGSCARSACTGPAR